MKKTCFLLRRVASLLVAHLKFREKKLADEAVKSIFARVDTGFHSGCCEILKREKTFKKGKKEKFSIVCAKAKK